MKPLRSTGKSRKLNTRLKRDGSRHASRHVLDVRIPSTKESRLRRAAQTRLALKLGGLLFLSMGLMAAGKTVMHRALVEGDQVALKQLDVRTTGSLTRAKILRVAKVGEGGNLLKIDLQGVRDNVGALPQVAGVRVTRNFPDKLTISVREREPLAWLSSPADGMVALTSNGGFLVDTAGKVFRCRDMLDEYTSLPVIGVPRGLAVKDGGGIDSPPVRAAIEVIRRAGDYIDGKGWSLRGVDVVAEFLLVMRFRNDAEVTIAIHDPDELTRQFQDLALIAATAREKEWNIKTLNVALRRNQVVTFFDRAGGKGDENLVIDGDRRAAPSAATAVGKVKSRRTRQILGILGGD